MKGEYLQMTETQNIETLHHACYKQNVDMVRVIFKGRMRSYSGSPELLKQNNMKL